MEAYEDDFDRLAEAEDDDARAIANDILARAQAEPRSISSLSAIGYAAFMHPDHKTDRTLQTLVRTSLTEVLTMGPDELMASWCRLYLGHAYYDRKRYGAALEALRKVDPELLGDWLLYKHAEMVTCCQIRLRPRDIVTHARWLVRRVSEAYPDDLTFTTLRAAVVEIGPTLDDETREALRPVLQALDDAMHMEAWMALALDGDPGAD